MISTKPIIICTILFVLGASEPIQPRLKIGNFGDDVMRDDFNPLAEFETNSSPQRKKAKDIWWFLRYPLKGRKGEALREDVGREKDGRRSLQTKIIFLVIFYYFKKIEKILFYDHCFY